MELEEKKVLLAQRFNPFVSAGQKEWWYTGVVDRENNIYFGFCVVRIMLLDSITLTLYDPGKAAPENYSWKGFLDRSNPAGRLSLCAHGHNFSFSYTGSAETGWVAAIESPEMNISLSMSPTIPYFTKFDDYFSYDYSLMHFFRNKVTGKIILADRTIPVEDGLSYYDHCFGNIPRKTGWHWLAVQGEQCALASLMNYGVDPQRYTEVWFSGGAADGASGRWVRLDQNVSFECEPFGAFEKPWRVTSVDLDLEVQIVGTSYEKERIPPLVPFLIKIDHYQCSISVHGRVRVDGTWIETGELRGVLEEHHGKW
jgi:hypothetical protein